MASVEFPNERVSPRLQQAPLKPALDNDVPAVDCLLPFTEYPEVLKQLRKLPNLQTAAELGRKIAKLVAPIFTAAYEDAAGDRQF